MATWFVIVGGLFSTIVSLMGDWMFIEISPLVEDVYENVSGFSLTASVGFYLVTIGMLMTSIVAETAFFKYIRSSRTNRRIGVSSHTRRDLVRKLLKQRGRTRF